MSDKIVRELIAELDADFTLTNPPRRPDALKTLVNRWKDSDPESKLPAEAQWELFLHDLMAIPRRNRQHPQDSPFSPMKTGFDRDAIAYYRSRAETTPNPIRKALYADFVWVALTKSREPDAYLFGIMAADAYLAQTDLCITQGPYQRLLDNLDRAAEVAAALNNRDLAERVATVITDILGKMPEQTCAGCIEQVADTLLYLDSKFSNLVHQETWEGSRKICDAGIAICESVEFRNPWSARDLMSVASRISDRLGDGASSWDYQVQIAESLENQSKQESSKGISGGHLRAYRHMEDAMHKYQQLASLAPNEEEKERVRRREEETRREVRRLIREAEANLKHLSVSAEIPREVLEQYIDPLLQVKPENTFSLLTIYPGLLPNIEEMCRQAEEAAEKPSLIGLAGRTTLRDGRKVGEIPSGDGETIHFLDGLGFWFQSHAQLLDYVIYRLRQEGRFSQESFMAHLERWEFLDEADARFIEVGLERYFADDYISAAHVLTPRIEHMIKSAFEQAGVVPIVSPDRQRIREQTFGDFLRRDEVRGCLGEDIWHYFYYAFVNELGLNIRNDIAHGWIHPEFCHRGLVQVVLFAILLLTRLGRKEEPQVKTDLEKVADEVAKRTTNDV